jgi:AraC-like DNA-binding protein
MGRVYAKPTITFDGRARNVEVAANRYQAPDVALAYTGYGVPLTAAYPENEFALQAFPIRGRAQMTINKVEHALRPGAGAIVSAGMRHVIKADGDYEHFLLVIRSRALTDKLRALTGATIERPLMFASVPDDGNPAAKALVDHFLFLVDKVSGPGEAPLLKYVLAEFEQTLMVMFLHANRHNYSHLLERAVAAAPWQVRRAEEYIEANWQQTITLEDLAKVSGASAFGLFRTFRRSRGYSPMEFASMVRLARAHERLQQPNCAATVGEVAATCGFADLDRFENDYIEAFGERPSRTLSRGKGIGPVWH